MNIDIYLEFDGEWRADREIVNAYYDHKAAKEREYGSTAHSEWQREQDLESAEEMGGVPICECGSLISNSSGTQTISSALTLEKSIITLIELISICS